MTYEAPEVVDLGRAENMIFGGCGDLCDMQCDEASIMEPFPIPPLD